MTLSVVIGTYAEDRWDGLVKAVESLLAQTRPAEQIAVVVDHNPALLARARSRFPDATVVASATRGCSGARNAGIRHARGEIVAFMDDDAVAERDWLERLLAPYDDERVVGVGGTITPDWRGGAPGWFPAEFRWVVGCTYRGMPEAPAPVRNLIGCNMSLRRSTLDGVGGFDEIDGLGHMGTVPVGCEETELCIRVRQLDRSAVLLHEPAAVVHHAVPPRRARFGYFLLRCALEGRSKAIVSRLAGARDGLSTERRYVMKVLPSGVLRGVADALRGDVDGLRRAGAIVVGLATTAATYSASRARLAALDRRRDDDSTGALRASDPPR